MFKKPQIGFGGKKYRCSKHNKAMVPVKIIDDDNRDLKCERGCKLSVFRIRTRRQR